MRKIGKPIKKKTMLYCKVPVVTGIQAIEGSQLSIYYDVENQGNEAYKVKPWSGCGCSTPEIPKDTIEPGETMRMKVVFDTRGKLGINTKSIGLWYGDKKRLDLKFTAEVVK